MTSRKTTNNKLCDELLGRKKKRNKLQWLKTIHKNFFGSIKDIDYPDVLKWYVVAQKALERNPCRILNEVQLPPVNIHEPYSMPGYSLNYVNDVLVAPFIMRRFDAVDEGDKIILPHRLFAICHKRCFFDSLEDDYMNWRFIQKKVYPYKFPHLKFYKRYLFCNYHRWQSVGDRGDMLRYLVRQIRRIERKFMKESNLHVLPMAAMRYNSPFHIQEYEIWKDYARDKKIFPKDMNMAYIRRNMDTIRDENFREITPCMFAAFREFRKIMVDMIHPRSFYYNEIWPLFNKNLLDVMNQICDPVSPATVNHLIKQFGKYVEYVRKITDEIKFAIDAEKCNMPEETDSQENLIKKFDEMGINVPRILEFPYCNYCRYGYRVSKEDDEEKQKCHIIHLEAPSLRAERFESKPLEQCHMPPTSDEQEYIDPCDTRCLSEESDSDEEASEPSTNALCLEIEYDKPKFKDDMKTVFINEVFWKLLWPARGCPLEDADTLSEICKLKKSLEPGTCIAESECESCEKLSAREKLIRRRILGLRPLSKKKAIETRIIHSLITGNIGKTDKIEELQTDHIVRGNLEYKIKETPPDFNKHIIEVNELKFSELLIALLGQWIDLGIIGKELPLVKVNKPVQSFPLIRERTEEEDQQMEEGEEEEEGIQVKEYRIPYVEFILKEVMSDKEPGEVLKAVVNKHLRRIKEEMKKNLATKNLSFSMDYLLKPFTYSKGVLKENPKLWKTCNKGKVYKTKDDIKQLAKYLLVNLIKQQLTEPKITKEDLKCDPEVVDFAECLLNIFNEYFQDIEFYHRGDDEESFVSNEEDDMNVKTRCQDENRVFESLINCLINHLPVKEVLSDIFGGYRERTRKFELMQAFEKSDPEFCKLIAPIIRALQGLSEKSSDEEEQEQEEKEKEGKEEGEKKRKKKKTRTKEWIELIQIAQDVLVRTKKLLNNVKIFKVAQLIDYSKAHKDYKLDCDLVPKTFNHSKELNDLKKSIKLILTRIKGFFKILFAVETRSVKIGLSVFLLNLVEKEKEKTIELKEITKILIINLRKLLKALNRYEIRNEEKGFNMYRFVYYLDNAKDDITAILKICKLILRNLVHDKPLNIQEIKIILETKAAAIKFRRKFELIPGYGRGFKSQELLPYLHEQEKVETEDRYAIGEWYKYGRHYLSSKTKTETSYKTKPRRKKRHRRPVFWNDMLLFTTQVQYNIKNIDEKQSECRKSEKSETAFQHIILRKLIDKAITAIHSDNSKNEQYKKHTLTKLKVKRTITDKNNNKKEFSKTFIKQETMVKSKSPKFSRYSLSDSDTNPFEDEIECKELRTQFKQVRRKNELENEMTRYCCTFRNM